jgi:hypothetical protein
MRTVGQLALLGVLTCEQAIAVSLQAFTPEASTMIGILLLLHRLLSTAPDQANRCPCPWIHRHFAGQGTDLPEILLDAPEVDRGLAVVVHDVAAQLPDGPLELVAVELELREPAPDAVQRVQQPLGLPPHALLHGRHDGVLGVALRLAVDQRPHHPVVLQAPVHSVPGGRERERDGSKSSDDCPGERAGNNKYLAAVRLVEGAVGIRRQREGAGDGGGGGARGGRHARRDARVLGGCWLGGVQGNWNPKREEGAGKGREEGVSVRKTRGASETKQNSLVGSRRGSRKAWWTLGERGAIDCEGMGWSTCERDLLATEYAARGQRERERRVAVVRDSAAVDRCTVSSLTESTCQCTCSYCGGAFFLSF